MLIIENTYDLKSLLFFIYFQSNYFHNFTLKLGVKFLNSVNLLKYFNIVL